MSASARSSSSQGVVLQAQGNVLPTIVDIHRVLAHPHVDECRQCKTCIPQHLIDASLGNSSTSSGGDAARHRGGILGALLGRKQHRHLLLQPGSRRRQRQSRHVRQQQWLQAAAAADSNVATSADLDSDIYEQRPESFRRRMTAKDIDGVKTHLEWLAKQQKGLANNNTRVVPGIEVIVGLPDHAFAWGERNYRIGPASIEQDARKIRNCAICRGCKQMLEPMPTGFNWLGSQFTHETGASPGWMVRVNSGHGNKGSSGSSNNSGSGGMAAAKIWCVPVPKPGSRIPALCNTTKIREQLQIVLAVQNVATHCGLNSVLPRHWVAPVDGVLPGVGFRVFWDGLWADLVVGASAENLVHGGKPRVESGLLLDYLHNQVNSTQVVMAAIFDLLFSQCDRHAQNLYLLPGGSISLIDNDQAYGSSWRPCGVDSLFLPGTQKHEVARLGYSYVMKKPEYAPPQQHRGYADPLQLLDYRCHTADGVLGTQFPAPVTSCLKSLSRMSPKAIINRFSYPNEDMAAALHQRAKDMLQRGFEWTLKYGWPQNPSPNRYKWSKACCSMRLMADLSTPSQGSNAERKYECTAWRDESAGWQTDLPVGGAALGAAWEYTGIDTGTYNLTQEWAEVAFGRPT